MEQIIYRSFCWCYKKLYCWAETHLSKNAYMKISRGRRGHLQCLQWQQLLDNKTSRLNQTSHTDQFSRTLCLATLKSSGFCCTVQYIRVQLCLISLYLVELLGYLHITAKVAQLIFAPKWLFRTSSGPIHIQSLTMQPLWEGSDLN